MPSIARAILLASHATAFTVLATICAVAAPLPPTGTLPSMHTVLYPQTYNQTLPRSMRIIRDPTLLITPSPPFARAISINASQPAKTASIDRGHTTGDPYSQFVHFYKTAKQNSRNLKRLAAQSASTRADDVAFQKKCSTQLNAFHANVVEQQAAFSAIDEEKRNPGKGLANYDKDSQMESLLKVSANTLKESLSCIHLLAKNFPILGPVIAPIVYDTKCLVDAIINSSEELLDGTINALPPPLRKLVGLSL